MGRSMQARIELAYRNTSIRAELNGFSVWDPPNWRYLLRNCMHKNDRFSAVVYLDLKNIECGE